VGDWGYGPFDNDDAADWIYEVEASDDLRIVKTKLTQVLDVEGELESPDAHEGLAAAEILAIAIGHGSSAVTRTFSAWISRLDERPTNADLALALSVIERVTGHDSELMNCWIEESNKNEWLEYVEGMKRRLRSTSDRDVYVEFERHNPDLSRPHEVNWFLYFSTEDAARTVAAMLSSEKFQIDVHKLDENSDCTVEATRSLAVSYMLVMRITNRVQQICEAHGGTFDGWGIEF
jgi:hypothetical protein